jgi:hypothetical protein
MPVVSTFYGIVVPMYYFDNRQRHLPHIHVQSGGEEAVITIPNGEVLEGTIPRNKLKLIPVDRDPPG